MSIRTRGPVRIAIAALGLTLFAVVGAPGTVAASGPALPTAAPATATWSHNPASSTGPEVWSSLDPAWTACANTEGQSPVVVTTTVPTRLPALRVDYPRTPLLVENTGHVVEVPEPAAGGGTLIVGHDGRHDGASTAVVTQRPEGVDATYRLQQWHIHAPAEHVVNGQRADLEIHLVHADAQGHTAVLAVFADFVKGQRGYGASAATQLLRSVLRAAPETAGEETDLHRTVSTAVLLGAAHSTRATVSKYLTYTGSLTTPPCTGGVQWFLLPQVITIDTTAVDDLHALIATFPGYGSYPDNNRPVQPLGTRTVATAGG